MRTGGESEVPSAAADAVSEATDRSRCAMAAPERHVRALFLVLDAGIRKFG
jgi:hypothetical protein